jgi:hypothetical protein
VEYNPREKRAEIGDRVALEVEPRDVIVLPQEEPGD